MTSASLRCTNFSVIGTLTAALLASAAIGQNPIQPPSGIIGWWALDNNASDIGPNSFNGSVTGAGGNFEPAHVLDGFRPNSGNGHIQVADNDVLDVRRNFTIELWVRLDDLTTEQTYFVNKGTDDRRTTPFTFGVIRNDDTGPHTVPSWNWFPVTSGASQSGQPWGGRPFFTVSDGNREQVMFGNAQVPRNVYSHMAVTVEPSGTLNQVRMYLNGTETNAALFGTMPFAGIAPLQIGGIGTGTDNSLNGGLDEVTMYDRALTVAEIRAIWLAGPDGKEKTIIDTTPPQLTIDQPWSGQILGDPMVAVVATVIDDGSTTVDSTPAGMSVQLPDGGGVASGSVMLSGPDGIQWITVQATDSAGNAAAMSVDIVLDTTAPVVTVISPQWGTVFGSSQAQLAIQVDDMTASNLDVAGTLIQIPAGGAAVSVDVSLVAGMNSIAISASDAAGNRTDISWDLALDMTAPMVSLLNPPDGSLFGAGQGVIAVTAQVDDFTVTTVSSLPAGVSGILPSGGGMISGAVSLQEGINQVMVTATDSAGSSSSASITVNLDTTAPSVMFASPVFGELLNGTVQVAADAQDIAPGSGVAQMDLFADRILVATMSGASILIDLDTTSLSDGDHVLMVVATDGAGNQGNHSMSITVDNTPPTIQILSPGDATVVSGTGQFSALVTDSGSGVMTVVQLVGGLAPTNDGSVQLTSPVPSIQVDGNEDTTRWPNGGLNCEVRATDMAGNYATASVSVEVLNQTLPDPTDISMELTPRDGKKVHGKFKIKLKAKGAYSMEIQVDGQTVAHGYGDKLKIKYDSTMRMDGPMVITGIVHHATGTSTTEHHVTVDNIHVHGLFPSSLGLWTSSKRGWVWIRLHSKDGMPPLGRDNDIELRPRGGAAVQALRVYRSRHGKGAWVVFSRSDLIASIRGAMATGKIEDDARKINLDCYIDGADVGSAKVKLYTKKRRGRWHR